MNTIAVKCQRCAFRGPQESFPRGPNLQYLKTCGKCLKKVADKRDGKKRQSAGDKENDIDETQPRKRAKPSHDEVPTLAWDTFISLLTENKGSAFELEALVYVPSGDPLTHPRSSLDKATRISRDIWDATGYRFKYVTYTISNSRLTESSATRNSTRVEHQTRS